MAVETGKWGIVYCPKAGITNKRKRWEKIQRILDDRHVNYDFVQSETSDSVERLMKMMISNGYKTIIIRQLTASFRAESPPTMIRVL